MAGTLRLTAPEQALAGLLALLPGPLAPVTLPLAEALGRVLAAPLTAPGPVPAVPLALRDGWAVAAAETLGAGPYAPVPLALEPARVAAGDPLPPGRDAVLPPFAVAMDGPFAQVLESAAPGEGVRLPGEEIAAGTVLRAAGERLAPRDLPALAACGIGAAAVRVPRLAWIEAGRTEAALPALFAALAAREGGALHALPPAGGDPAAIATALAGAAGHELVLLAGGTGEGPADHAAEALAAAGRLVLHGLGARPGMTAGFGTVEAMPVLLLPGRAEDALAAWVLLGRPALRHLAGAAPAVPIRARLTRKVASTVGLLEIVPVRLADGTAEPLTIGAIPLQALAAADALLLVPPGVEGHEAGNEVLLHPL